MSRTAKIIVGILAILIILCIGSAVAGLLLFRSAGQVLSNSLEANPEKAAQIGSSIAEYSLPEDFGAAYGAKLAGFSLVGYTGEDGHSHIYLMQIPGYVSIDQAEIERQLQQATINDSSTRPDRLEVVDRQTVSIRGQMITLVISEGTDGEGQVFRVANAMFEGKGGHALVNISAPVQYWDQDMVDAFLASLR